MSLTLPDPSNENRSLNADERVSLASALLLGWQIAIEESGEEVFTENHYEFIPVFLTIAKNWAAHWGKTHDLTVASHDDNEGKIQRRLGPFPTLSIPIHEDILIDGNFVDGLENSVADIAKNPRSILTPAEMNDLYHPVKEKFAELLEQSFVVFCMGFEVMQPHKGRSRIIHHKDEDEGKGSFGGGQNHRVKWQRGKESFLPPSN